jgi:hypothetical protein
MAIYMVDYENVYIEGLRGINELTEADTLHIFYTQNRCGLTFGLYEQLIHSRAKVNLNEVAVSPKNGDPVKNALDIQLMMFAGYLIGSRQSEKLFIVSKDKDFLLGSEFYTQYIHDASISLQIVPSIEASFPEPEPETEAKPAEQYDIFVKALQSELDASEPGLSFAMMCDRYAKDTTPPPMPPMEDEKELSPSSPVLPPEMTPENSTEPLFTVQYYNTVRNLLGKNTDEETISRVCEMISVSDSLVAFNNALARYYRDGQRAKLVYHKFKPKFENLRQLSRGRKKG